LQLLLKFKGFKKNVVYINILLILISQNQIPEVIEMKKPGLLVAVMLVSVTAVMAAPGNGAMFEEGEGVHEGLMIMETGNGGFQAFGEGIHAVGKSNGNIMSENWVEHTEGLWVKINTFGPTLEE